jgi:hypothetical protein
MCAEVLLPFVVLLLIICRATLLQDDSIIANAES